MVTELFRHCWQDKKKVACRHDWHQTANQVVITIYAKNANPQHSYVEANRTVVSPQPVHTSNLIALCDAGGGWNFTLSLGDS